MIVASPGLLCSVSDDPSRRAITVCRRTCSCPPKTVEELRPLDSSFARSRCSRPMASRDSFFTVFAFRLVAPFGLGVLACVTLLVTLHDDVDGASSESSPVPRLPRTVLRAGAHHQRLPSRSMPPSPVTVWCCFPGLRVQRVDPTETLTAVLRGGTG